MKLNNRQQAILRAVIDDYIETAEPVGSKNLVSRHAFPVSSATVRNEMAELEEQGYLEQKHTSAGRVPSDKGYRAYVDNLLRASELTPAEEEQIRSYLSECIDEVSDLIRRASTVLSDQTGYTSLVLTPQLRRSQLKQLKMMMIEPGRALVVVVLEAGVVKDRLVRIPSMIDSSQLMQIANAIEDSLTGMKLDDITLVTVTSAGRKTELPDSLLNQVLYEAYVAIKQADNLEVYMEGAHKMLSYPEFQNIDKAKDYYNTLSRDGIIAGYMNELSEERRQEKIAADAEFEALDEQFERAEILDDKEHSASSQTAKKQPAYMVRIGQEIALEGFSDCSLVTTSYRIGDTVVGNMGVIGPRRMEYGKVFSNISYIKTALDAEIRKIASVRAESEDQH